MNSTKIIEYQKLDAQLRQIEKQLGDSPERLKSRHLSNFLVESGEELKKMDARANELSIILANLTSTFSEKQETLDEYTVMVDKVIDADELSYLAKKVSELSKTISACEREISAIIAEIEEINKKYELHRERVPVAKKQYVEYKNAFDALVAARGDEVKTIRREMAAAEKQIDPAAIAKFKQLKSQSIYPPFALLLGSSRCGGCQMEMSGSLVSRIDNNGFVECENCHRIIFKPE